MRRIAAWSLCVLCLLAACDDGTIEEPVPDVFWETVHIRDLDFVKNTYFFFNPDGAGPLIDENTLNVYKELKGYEVNELGVDAMACRAFIDMDGTGASIDQDLEPLAAGNWPWATSEWGWFKRLQLGVDYVFIVDANDLVTPIGIQLAQPISETEQRVLAVSYTTEDGDQVGGQLYHELWGGAGPFPDPSQPSQKDTLALKIIKNRSLRPYGEFYHQWNFMWRNIYNLGLTDIDPAYFDVQIEDVLDPREDPSRPAGSDVPYLRIFGLDRYADLFDLGTGVLAFPALHGFSPPKDSVVVWTGGEFSFDDPAYQLQYEVADSMYRTPPTLSGFQNLHQYNIVVRVGHPAQTRLRSR